MTGNLDIGFFLGALLGAGLGIFLGLAMLGRRIRGVGEVSTGAEERAMLALGVIRKPHAKPA